MNKEKKNKTAKYIIGSVVMAGVSIILLPRIIDTISSELYKKMPRKKKFSDDEDLNPEIIKIVKEEKNELV